MPPSNPPKPTSGVRSDSCMNVRSNNSSVTFVISDYHLTLNFSVGDLRTVKCPICGLTLKIVAPCPRLCLKVGDVLPWRVVVPPSLRTCLPGISFWQYWLDTNSFILGRGSRKESIHPENLTYSTCPASPSTEPIHNDIDCHIINYWVVLKWQ